ncbi:hypothetical protein QFC24_006019 [Naganishia onofrii]|uniref:Uncharacterized protein n=1 Tax=Naganishia onofrii TaxID=1851511 RepID=A0ACC2X5E9_9TREE|nr:hypothetical protein QFC24_006019 [Naganishia onofrii]
MGNFLLSLGRARTLLLLVALMSASTFLLYTSSSFSKPFLAPGYESPSTVLPNYISPASIPYCLPENVGDHAGIHIGGLYGDEDEARMYEDQQEDTVPVEAITNYMQQHINNKQKGFDPQADDDYLGLKIGDSWDLPSYRTELLGIYHDYLALPHIPNPSFLPPLKSRLSLRPPIAPLPPRPNQVLTTDKDKDLPWEFGRWKELHPDWEIRFFDDDALDRWVRTVFGGTRAEKVWNTLPRPVLKADIFRYMAMFVEGGIYTDSDTAPVIPADQWGIPHENATDPLLSHLSRLLSQANPAYISPAYQNHERQLSDEEISSLDRKAKRWPVPVNGPTTAPIVNDGAELGPPSLVVSVESDAISFGWHDWRDVGLSRAVQIVQWTMMARPGHPVFLDAVGRTLRKTEGIVREEREAKAKGETYMPDSALDWTGPGVFTDCVYRYMLARYGFQPRELIHQKEPLRVGDVLILPAGSYSSVSPWDPEDKWRRWAAVWHGFWGRWRDTDPNITEKERLKKIKEDADEAAAIELEQQESEGRVDPQDDQTDVP